MSVSGVLNSCEIFEKKIVLARSSSAKASARFRSSSRDVAVVIIDAILPEKRLKKILECKEMYK